MLDERSQHQVIWLLKRLSSVTFWKHVLGTQKAYLDAIEHNVKNHPEDDPSELELDLYKRALNDVVHLQKGIQRLGVGDRSVFHRHSKGHFTLAGESCSLLLDLLRREDYMECPELYIRDGARLKFLADAACDAYGYGLSICEPEMRSGPSAGHYASWMLLPRNLPKYGFPESFSNLPDMTNQSVMIKTGEEIPIAGIYEPNSVGTCMNYLLSGTLAPLAMQEYGNLTEEIIGGGERAFLPNVQDIPVTWRLIWEDHRYEDKQIPDEEKDYFLPLSEKEVGITAAPTEKLRALPGETCLRAGYWWTPAREGSRRYFERNEVFPDFPASNYGATIWYFDRKQK